jgi:hypothetical protein
MNTLDLGRASQDRELRDDELDAVSGGNEGYPGLPLGSKVISPTVLAFSQRFCHFARAVDKQASQWAEGSVF